MDTLVDVDNEEWRRSSCNSKTNNRPCDTSFLRIFLIEIDFNYSQVPQGHVQHPGGRRQRGHGVVHHVPLIKHIFGAM